MSANDQQNSYTPMDPKSAQVVNDSYWLNQVPEIYRNAVAQNAQQNGIPVSTAVKMLTIESHFNPNAVSKSGALGIAQVLPSTGADMGYSPQQLMNPEMGIAAGLKYLGQMYNKYGSEDSALAAYNMGPGNMDKVLAGKMPMPTESANYIVNAHRLGTMGSGNPQIQSNNDYGNHSDTLSNINDMNKDTWGMMARSPFPHANTINMPDSTTEMGPGKDAEQPQGLLALVQGFNSMDKQRLAKLTEELES